MGAVIVAGRYVPRPPEDNIWAPGPFRAVPENFLPVGGGFPFKNKRWAFNLDDATVWYRNGSSFSALRIPPPPVLPFSNNQWSFKGSEFPVWAFWKYQQSGSPLLYISVAAAAPFAPGGWPLRGTDPPAWDFWKYQQFGTTINMPVGGGFPFVNKRWAFNHQTEPVWQNASVPVPPVLGLVGGNFPFKPTFWQQNADDAGVWSNKSFGPSLVLELASNLPVSKPPYWKYNNDDAPVWSGGPRNVGRVIDFALVTPLTPKRWAFDYDDAATWYAKSSAVPEPYLPAPVAPLTPKRWVFDLDQPREWVGQPFPAFNALSQTLQLYAPAAVKPFPIGDDASAWAGNRTQVNNLLLGQVVAAPFIPTFWGYDNDDAAIWRGFPANVSIVQQLVIAAPLTPTRWTRDYDQSAFWSGAPTNVPITITQPLPPIVPPVDVVVPPPLNNPAGDIVGKRKKKKKKHVEPPQVIRRGVYERIIEQHEAEKVEDALEEKVEAKVKPVIGSLADLAPLPGADAKAVRTRKQQEEEAIALYLLGFL